MKLIIEEDKRWHILAGYVITIIVTALIDLRTGIASGVVAGAFKETLDWYDYGVFDKRDMLFTWVGAIMAGLLLVAIG